jgi:hypothetical protein
MRIPQSSLQAFSAGPQQHHLLGERQLRLNRRRQREHDEAVRRLEGRGLLARGVAMPAARSTRASRGYARRSAARRRLEVETPSC